MSANRRRRWVWRALVLVVVALAAIALATVGRAGLEARAGYQALRTAQRSVGDDPRSAERWIARARTKFAAAEAHTRSPLAGPLRILPLVGRQVSAIGDLAHDAADVSAIGQRAFRELPSLDGGIAPAERIPLARSLARIAKRTSTGLARVDPGDDDWLITPVAAVHRRFVDELTDLQDTARRAAIVAEELDGFLAGPRRYLVLAANNGEMRAGQGMFLSAGTLTIENGSFELSEMESTVGMRLPEGAVPLDGDLAALWGRLNPHREWRNLGLSPRFDVTGKLAARMWEARGQEPVDGVLALDAKAFAELIGAIGTVDVDERSIGPDNALSYVLHDQYLGVPATELGKAERRERLADLAGAAVERLDAGDWKPVDLARRLAAAAAGRHLLAWSSRDADLWEAAGVTGRLAEDSLLVAVLNRGGNKLDQFLDVETSIDIADGPQGGRAVTLRVTVDNRTPSGEPGYIAGPHPLAEAPRATYLGILAVSLPGAATRATIEGVDELQPGGRDGPTVVVGAPVRLRAGASRTYVVRFELPRTQGSIRIEPSARVPAIGWSSRSRSWTETGPEVVVF